MTDLIEKFEVKEPFLDLNGGLLEGPFHEGNQNLRFVDIVKNEVHWVNHDEGPLSHRRLKLDVSISTTAEIEGHQDEFIFGGKVGFGIFDRRSEKYHWIKRFWNDAEVDQGNDRNLRANDGSVDSEGRYWVGTMNDPLVKRPTNEGILFRLDRDLSLHRVITGVTIPNGISWTQDNRTMYFTDSPTKCVFAYDFDAPTGEISNKRVFFQTTEPLGVPDGHCLDTEGFMWIALYGCGKVVRVNTEGQIVAKIKLPTRCVTCPCFVGDWLYVTSAREDEPDQFPESMKFQGSLFRCHVGTHGAPDFKFRYLR